MTHNLGSTPRVPRSRFRSLALTALSGLAAFSAAPAAEPAPRAGVSDVVLARSALAAIDADPVLRDANLLVSVVDRVAVVGGPVRSSVQATRAAAVVRNVPGIADVKNRCFVQDTPDPLLQAMSARPATNPANLPGVVASPRTGQVEELTPPPGGIAAKVEPAGKPVVALRPSNPGDSVLLPPVPDAPAAIRSPEKPGVLTAGRTAEALAAAEGLRKSDAKYAGLSIAYANGTFVIAGRAARIGDAWDLAQEIRRIPGVPRVAVGSVDVK
ncbi:MAG: BON domain-containing protein [Gemmataceae bacterium]